MKFNSYSLTASASHSKVTPVLLKIILPAFPLMGIYLDLPNPWTTWRTVKPWKYSTIKLIIMDILVKLVFILLTTRS